jgi:aubergine-like protein
VTLSGRKLDSGHILMAKKGDSRINFPTESEDIDRKIQNEMYSQPMLNKWVIFSTQRDQEAVSKLQETLGQVKDSFKYPMNPPHSVTFRSMNFNDWQNQIESTVNGQNVMLVVLVLPGGKGKGTHYDQLKRLLTTKLQIPSQVVLASTINKPRGLRSVINKVLLQICAKVGGEPWAISEIPFTSEPTMVVGLDVYNKLGKTILGCCATINRNYTKYVSLAKADNQGADLSNLVAECITEASKNFAAVNKIAPKHVIILRDGIAPTQIHIATSEIKAILAISENIKLTYILLNKKTTMKVFVDSNNNFSNIPPGTLVDKVVTDAEKNDFFLVSQKSPQGLSQATHYNVIYDNSAANVQDIHNFVYKLCYLYFNWTGGIKIPAPCQYAKKLAFLVGDKLSSKEGIVVPGEKFLTEIRSLYFL